MGNFKVFFVISFVFCVSILSSQTNQSPLQVKEYVLSNGLTVWLNEDHSSPQVFGAVVVKAGARDCPNTGIAHYFEHIMFKGTDKIGTIDYESEKVFLDSIAAKYEELAGTKDNMLRAEIQKEINRLSISAAKFAIPNEFDKLISENGGSRLNAYTSPDVTVYHNSFSPQYMEQWAELNSERLISPVFRLFQSELETVYEEKNMHINMSGSRFGEKLNERIMSPSPYSFSVIGSTENLKNPRLSEMKAFFEKYYVASNMGLLLSGDFESEKVLPVLEKAFSRIPQGEKPERIFTNPDYFTGKESFRIRIIIPKPILKMQNIVHKGITKFDKDHNALNLIVNMLNNPSAGYLNQLKVDRKIGDVTINNIDHFERAAMVNILIIPKFLIQSFGKANSLVMNEVNRIKTGDFTDEMFEGAKMDLKKSIMTSLEDVSSRSQVLISCISSGVKWDDFLSSVDAIDVLKREDIVRVANECFGDDYLDIRNKFGNYPKDKMQKPPYKPIVSPNKDSSSVYAQAIKAIPVSKPVVRIMDFDNDAQTINLQPLTTLYTSKNPVNDIFTLKIAYSIGTLKDRRLSHLAGYMEIIGTDSLSFEEFGRALYNIGAEVSYEANDLDFIISVKGFDKNFDKAVKLTGDFMNKYKVESKKLKPFGYQGNVKKISPFSSSDMALALFEKVSYGDESRYLKKSTIKKDAEISELFEKVLSTECDIHYCGSNTAQIVEQHLRNYLPLDKIKNASEAHIEREPLAYDKPVIYFLNMPRSTQSIIYSYVAVDTLESINDRYDALMFSKYLGGGMSSVMFQEIREFRSLAYSAGASFTSPVWKDKNHKSFFRVFMSTQNDKTADALSVLDSLQRNISFISGKIETTKNNLFNETANRHLPFRNVSTVIARMRRNGYDEDPTKYLVQYLDDIEIENIETFYKRQIKEKPVVYCIVGSAKKIDMKRLESMYQVVKVKKRDINK
jgi:Predicted Zn-dependent peptidases